MTGTPTVRGIVQIRDGSSNTLLVAESDGASASCGDQNGNGQPGITDLAFLTRHARTGERVPVSLTTAETEDIDRNGRHTVAFRAGDFSTHLAIMVRAVPRRRRPRPRRRRR